jgi:hypothetical protein
MPCPTYNTGYKIYIITKNHINIITDIILHTEQDDFREEGSCTDCVFLVSQLIEKHIGYTYKAFTDFEKASDTQPNKVLGNII